MNPIMEELKKTGIIPVVVLNRVEDALPLAKALRDAGMNCAEITFRTAAAKESIEKILEVYPDMCVGAGTVLTTEQMDDAVKAGAKFIVSPGFDPTLIYHAMDLNVPVLPGVLTPSEIQQAMGFDLSVLKFFPAEPSGGIKMIKAISAAFPGITFMPTGGISPDNVRDYLNEKCIFGCGGSWMVKGKLIDEGNFEKIKELTEEAVKIVKEVRP